MFWKKRGHEIKVLFTLVVNPSGNTERISYVLCRTCSESYTGESHREFREWLRKHKVKVRRK